MDYPYSKVLCTHHGGIWRHYHLHQGLRRYHDPIDDAWKRVEHLCNLHVTDSGGDGFRIAYVTSKAVTPARLKEIESRKPIQEAMERLQKEAPEHFGGSLYETDIYEFAAFARKYDVDPILEIHCIFVEGRDKCNLYAGPNPKIPDSPTYIDRNTEQGVQWIDHNDVYYRTSPEDRVYRYWKCEFPFNTSVRTSVLPTFRRPKGCVKER